MSSITSQRRWWILLPLLGLALWLFLFGDKTPVNALVSAPRARPESLPNDNPKVNAPSMPGDAGAALATRSSASIQPKVASSKGAGSLTALTARDQLIAATNSAKGSRNRDLFASSSWSPPARAPLHAAAPSAPALPFIFIGKKLEDAIWEVYLAQGDKSYVLREGSLIDNTYRIDKIDPPSLSLTYLPLGQSQNLSIGESR